MFLLLTALCAFSPVFAQDIPEEVEEIDVPDAPTKQSESSGFDLGQDKFQVEDDDEDVPMLDYAAEALKRPADPTHFHLDPTGKTPLTNDYPMQVVAMGKSWMKLELPVLVATDRASFVAAYPHGLRVVSEWDVGGAKLTSEQVFHANSVRENGPTFAFFDVGVEDARKSAPVRILIKSAALGDAAAEPPVPAASLKDRYAVTSVFYRKE